MHAHYVNLSLLLFMPGFALFPSLPFSVAWTSPYPEAFCITNTRALVEGLHSLHLHKARCLGAKEYEMLLSLTSIQGPSIVHFRSLILPLSRTLWLFSTSLQHFVSLGNFCFVVC